MAVDPLQCWFNAVPHHQSSTEGLWWYVHAALSQHCHYEYIYQVWLTRRRRKSVLMQSSLYIVLGASIVVAMVL